MDAPYVMALTLAAIITLAICMQYLALRSSITSRLGNIEKLEREVEALRAEGLSLRDAVRQAARETGLAKNELYDRAVGKAGGCE